MLDTFAGSGSTLAAARHLGYESVGVELSDEYAQLAASAIPQLAALGVVDSQEEEEIGEASHGLAVVHEAGEMLGRPRRMPKVEHRTLNAEGLS